MTTWNTSQQIALLFVLWFGLLIAASAGSVFASLRAEDRRSRERLQLFNGHLRAWWTMAAIFWLAWVSGREGATVLFALASFFTLREFVTLTPTRLADHRALVISFFLVLPLQYLFIALGQSFLFEIFIPVYVFLLLPALGAFAGDPTNFLERHAKIQWGILVCVYGLSHLPALVYLHAPGWTPEAGAFILFLLVFVIALSSVVQAYASRRLKLRYRVRPVAFEISRTFTWQGALAGIAAGTLAGAALSPLTPLSPFLALGMSFVACASGSLGHLVMQAIKRGRGVRTWSDTTSSTFGVTGTTGLLDRVDALCFAAPVFYNTLRAYYHV